MESRTLKFAASVMVKIVASLNGQKFLIKTGADCESMDSSRTKIRRFGSLSAALFLIGLVAGAGVAYVLVQVQFAQLSGELVTVRKQLGDTRSDLTRSRDELEKAKAPALPAFASVSYPPSISDRIVWRARIVAQVESLCTSSLQTKTLIRWLERLPRKTLPTLSR